VPECPVEAISEGDPIYIIDAEKCTDCGACATVCPVEANNPKYATPGPTERLPVCKSEVFFMDFGPP
jgi:Fe-S-cluster-containing hydrogenase component 2